MDFAVYGGPRSKCSWIPRDLYNHVHNLCRRQYLYAVVGALAVTSSLLQVSSWATSVSSISTEIWMEESTPPQVLHSAGLQEAPHGHCQGLQLAPSGVVGWVSPGPIWTTAGMLRTYTSGTSRQGAFSVPWRPSHSEPVIGSLKDFFKPSVGEGVVCLSLCVCWGWSRGPQAWWACAVPLGPVPAPLPLFWWMAPGWLLSSLKSLFVLATPLVFSLKQAFDSHSQAGFP